MATSYSKTIPTISTYRNLSQYNTNNFKFLYICGNSKDELIFNETSLLRSIPTFYLPTDTLNENAIKIEYEIFENMINTLCNIYKNDDLKDLFNHKPVIIEAIKLGLFFTDNHITLRKYSNNYKNYEQIYNEIFNISYGVCEANALFHSATHNTTYYTRFSQVTANHVFKLFENRVTQDNLHTQSFGIFKNPNPIDFLNYNNVLKTVSLTKSELNNFIKYNLSNISNSNKLNINIQQKTIN